MVIYAILWVIELAAICITLAPAQRILLPPRCRPDLGKARDRPRRNHPIHARPRRARAASAGNAT
jgi:hypothetical protein